MAKGTNEFALNVYRQQTVKSFVKILWAVVLIQFPVGYLFAMYKLYSLEPTKFLIGASVTSIVGLIIFFLLKTKIVSSNISNICILVSLIIGSGYLTHNYYNAFVMHIIWIFPVIISSLFFEKKVTIFTIMSTIFFMLILDFTEPWNARFPHVYHRFFIEKADLNDIYYPIIVNIICIDICIYFTFRRTLFILENIDNTMKTVTRSTSMINHAIINSLVNIKYGIDLIESENAGNEDLLKRTQVIRNETEHLETIVNRLKANLLNVEVVPQKEVDISAIIDSCINSYQELCEGKEIQVINRSQPGILVDCDPIHFREVLSNFIKNAIEAIGTKGKIQIDAYCQGNKAHLCVADTGCGISGQDLPHVTDPFISTKRSGNHLGLGLTYSYTIIKQHQGELMIDSDLGKGTTVNVWIPQKMPVKA